jgi:hypothetical protein
MPIELAEKSLASSAHRATILSTMFDRFTAARLKLERAEKHVADLEAIICGLPDAYISTIERHEDLGLQAVKYSPPDLTKITADMAVIIGDAFHNLRTAIEYSYLGAVERHAPAALDTYTKFPTGETRKDVENRLKGRRIDLLSPKLFDRIVTNIRPYVEGGNCLITFLHDLDVSDKHWLITPLVSVAEIRDIVVENQEGSTVTGNTYPITGDGPYTVSFPLNYKIKSKGKLTLDVVFGEIDISLLKGMSVMSDLKDSSKITAYIIQILSSF